MAVVPFSMTMRVRLWLLNTAFTTPGRPAWKKVESPMKLTTFLEPLNRESPAPVPVECPMDRRTSPIS